MGHVILPTGSTVFVEELNGSVNLSQLVTEMKCDDYTASYRISVIAALGKLSKNAVAAVPYLKELILKPGGTANEKLLAEAADQAIKRIEDTSGKTETYGPNRVDNHTTRHNNYAGSYNTGYTANNYSGTVTPTTSSVKKPDINKVEFTEIKDDKLHEGLKVYCRCNFCEKMTMVNRHQQKFSDKLGGVDRFFCNFCIRNDYYHRCNNNVMVLTYRGILGYYYYSYYAAPKSPTMHLIDIQDYLELHVRIGVQNPIFRYDPETFCWFIDFSKIGKRKMPVESVLQTIIEQLACFNLYENVREASPMKLYHKYQQAVMEFNQHRARTNGDKVFAPTLFGCDIPNHCSAGVRALPVDILQSFLPMNLVDNNKNTHRRF